MRSSIRRWPIFPITSLRKIAMTSKHAVVFGAGKIARGFVGHLLGLSGFSITFVDIDAVIVDLLHKQGKYTVHVLGAPQKDTVIEAIEAITTGDTAVAAVLDNADVVFVSVGGRNLRSVGATIAGALRHRFTANNAPLNIVVCENWTSAGEALRAAIEAALDPADRATFAKRVGVAESTIMRSGIAATPEQLATDPLAVQAQDFWLLPVDADALVGELPAIEAVEPVHNFSNALERKIYTYNSGNATISYLGWLRGHQYLSEAANDPAIGEIVRGVYTEMSEAMVRRFGFDPEDQRVYAERSFNKFKDAAIVDPITRQVNDPLRKLGPHDRLVGAGLVAMEQGVRPESLAVGIAAALRHRNADDPSAVQLAELIDKRGEAGALAEIGGLPETHELIALAISKLPIVDALTTIAPTGPDAQKGALR
jgi:mannitol-1-phosphate 5-dehydrogenase